jgi:hypothetical protein
MRRFSVMRAEQGARVRRRSWAGYIINMFEFEFPTGTGIAVPLARRWAVFSDLGQVCVDMLVRIVRVRQDRDGELFRIGDN